MAQTADGLGLPRLSPPPRVLLVIAPYYRAIAEGQLAGARAVLDAAGCEHKTVEVPGALEISPAIRLAAQGGRFEGYVALGCVIRGETTHYQTVCEESARGITLLGVDRGLCIGNGILTVEREEQARERADPGGMDKGGGAAAAVLHLIALARRFGVEPPAGAVPEPDAGDILLAEGAARTRTA